MSFTVDVDCSDIKKVLGGNDVGQFLANRAAEYMEPYVPYRTGHLSESHVETPFLVEYVADYAGIVYEGRNMTIHKDRHPMATSHWDKAAAADHGGELAEDLYEYLERRG